MEIIRKHYVWDRENQKYLTTEEKFIVADSLGNPVEVGDKVGWIHSPSNAPAIITGTIKDINSSWVTVEMDEESKVLYMRKGGKGIARLDVSIGHVCRPLPYGQVWGLHRLVSLM